MGLSLSKIIIITFISVLLSLIYNHFNPIGLRLIREDKKLVWESDSQLSSDKVDSSLSYKGPIETKSPESVPSGKNELKSEPFKEPKAIKLDYAFKLFKDGIQFIDARSPEEFAEGHIKGAINIPFYGSENYLDAINHLNKNEFIVTYCSGADCDISILSGNELFEMGFKRVYVFIGGYDEWTKNHYPITKN
ncbi:MAG TPA: rhodanese-like domain-containing protein [Ignavibacteriaceae bacterium]